MTLEDQINGYFDGHLSPDEIRALERQLRTSKDARRLYWDIASVHSSLEKHFSEKSGLQIAEDLQPQVIETPYRPNWFRAFAPLAAAAAVIAAFVAFQSTPPSPTVVSNTGVVARWDDDWRFLQPGELSLNEGEHRELVFVTGVRVALEGPIDGRLVSSEKMAITQGRIGVHVPPGGEGFTVDTPEGEVVDFGTRFGLSVTQNTLRAEVFEGRIDVNVGEENFRMEGQASLEVVDKRASGVASGSNAQAYPMPSTRYRDQASGLFDDEQQIAPHHPTGPNQWAGDPAQTVGSTHGIVPRSGNGMLQFLSSHDPSNSAKKTRSQVWRVIDLEEVTRELGRRPERVQLTAWCNRIAATSFPTSKFVVELGANPNSSDFFQWSPDATIRSQGELLADVNPESWERIEVDLSLPDQLRYLTIMLSAQENTTNRNTTGDRVGFDSHFIDDVELEFIAGLRPALAR